MRCMRNHSISFLALRCRELLQGHPVLLAGHACPPPPIPKQGPAPLPSLCFPARTQSPARRWPPAPLPLAPAAPRRCPLRPPRPRIGAATARAAAGLERLDPRTSRAHRARRRVRATSAAAWSASAAPIARRAKRRAKRCRDVAATRRPRARQVGRSAWSTSGIEKSGGVKGTAPDSFCQAAQHAWPPVLAASASSAFRGAAPHRAGCKPGNLRKASSRFESPGSRTRRFLGFRNSSSKVSRSSSISDFPAARSIIPLGCPSATPAPPAPRSRPARPFFARFSRRRCSCSLRSSRRRSFCRRRCSSCSFFSSCSSCKVRVSDRSSGDARFFRSTVASSATRLASTSPCMLWAFAGAGVAGGRRPGVPGNARWGAWQVSRRPRTPSHRSFSRLLAASFRLLAWLLL